MRRCTSCGTKIAGRPENPWAPFCGERCKLVDLGKWLGEEYRVPTAPRQEGDAPASLESASAADDDPGDRLH